MLFAKKRDFDLSQILRDFDFLRGPIDTPTDQNIWFDMFFRMKFIVRKTDISTFVSFLLFNYVFKQNQNVLLVYLNKAESISMYNVVWYVSY